MLFYSVLKYFFLGGILLVPMYSIIKFKAFWLLVSDVGHMALGSGSVNPFIFALYREVVASAMMFFYVQ